MLAVKLDPDAPVVLGGRTFTVIDFDRRTVRQDHYLQTRIQDAALDRVMPMDNESDAAYLVRMQNAIIRSGRAPELIACFLLPEGMTNAEWTADIAKQTAHFIGGLDTEADREEVHRLAMEAVFGFFRQGLERLKRSLERSGLVDAGEPSPSPRAMH